MPTPLSGRLLVALCLSTLTACQGEGNLSSLAQQEQAAVTPPPGGGDTPPPPLPPLDIAVSARRVVSAANTAPTSFRLWRSVDNVPRTTFFTRFANSFHLGTNDTMVATTTRSGDRGYVHTRYQQKLSGVPVENAMYALTELSDAVVSGVGRLAPGLTVSTTPAVTAPDALTAALTSVNATQYLWQLNPAEPSPTGTLVIYSPDFGETLPFRLAYRFDLTTTQPTWDSVRVYVDAQDAHVIEKASRLRHLDTPATGKTLDGRDVSFTADQYQTSPLPTAYRLQESGTRKVITRDGDPLSAVPGVDFLDSDNLWNETANRRGVSAHWAGERGWDYLQATLGISGFDGLGVGGIGIQLVTPAASRCGVGSHFNPATNIIGLCSFVTPPGLPDVDLESAGHEMGHFLEHMAFGGFGSALEPDGLSEGIADIFATSVNASAFGDPNDWLLFDKAISPDRRSLQNPKAYSQPDTYKGLNWLAAVTAHSGHRAAGVITHWFYFLAAGGAGTNDLDFTYSVTGIGRQDAEEITFHTLMEKLTPASTFADFREATVLTAGERFGDDSPQQRAVAAAWAAVGLPDASAPDNSKFRLPSAGEQAVPAWPTLLTFETPLYSSCRVLCPPESMWQVQLSDDPTFATHLQTFNVTSQSVLGARTVSRASANLKPITVYYWRVRSYRGGAWDTTWRFTSSFETSHMTPTGILPSHGATNLHPWPVSPVSWDAVPGATGYRVIVSEAASLSPLTFYMDMTDPHADNMQVSMNKTYYWTVLARGPDGNFGTRATRYHTKNFALASPDDLERNWVAADSMSFTTNTPTVTFTSPTNGSPTYPWPVNMSWNAVGGVTGYELQLAAVDDPSFTTPLKTLQLSGTTTHATANVKPEKNKRYYWRVRAQSEDGEVTPWSNGGTPLNQFFVMNDDSTPTPLHPTHGDSVSASNVVFEWTPVANATAYQVDVSRVEPGVGAVPVGTFRAPFPATSFTLAGPLQYPKQHTWQIRAIGPENLDGMTASASAGGGFNTLEPPAPSGNTTCNAAVQAGTNVVDERTFSLGKKSGTFAFAYKTYDIHDRITILYQGSQLWTSGCVKTPDPNINDHSLAPWTNATISFNGNDTQLKIRVEPNCDPSTASPTTEWVYQISCP
ncbi:M4 family metallopeptidase [Myxococcaceae bacterium JPH2]|nr:M4 family metallopeptidase [Myxococcaceae bacterium JPH2]